MELLRAEIKQFRSIKSQTITFDESCLVLLGINETGKSNILRALSLLSPSIGPTPDDVRQLPSDETASEDPSVRFVFSSSAADLSEFNAAIERAIVGADKIRLRAGDIESTLTEFLTKGYTEILYTVGVPRGVRHFSRWRENGELVDDCFAPADGCPNNIVLDASDGRRVKLLETPVVVGSALPEGLSANFVRKLSFEQLMSACWAAVSPLLAAKLPPCISWSFQRDNELPRSIQFPAFANDTNTAPALKNMFELAGITNIQAEVEKARSRANGMRTLLERVASRATKELQQLWTDKNIKIELHENGTALDCVIRDVHGSYDFARRSDGFRRFVSFLLVVSARARSGSLTNALLLYDEPDTSLHPAGARQLRDELLRLSATCRVVYSTHSIFMVDPGNVGRHLLVRREHEQTTATRAEYGTIRDEEVLYQAIGHTIFANIRKMNLLFEGHHDRRLIEVALQHNDSQSFKPVMDSVGICHAGGVKNVPRVVPMIELTKRSYLIISDADAPALEAQRHFNGGDKWKTYKDLVGGEIETAEDFIKPEVFGAAIQGLEGTIAELRGRSFNYQEDKPILKQIENSLSALQNKKRIVEAIKARVFADLRPEHLRPTAIALIGKIAVAVGA
jgi:hypothetical protein